MRSLVVAFRRACARANAKCGLRGHAMAASLIRDESALNAAGDVFVASMRVATPHQITVAFNSFAGLRFNHSAFIRASSDRIIAEVQSFSDEDLGLIVLACDRLRIKPAQMLQKIAKYVEPRFGYLRGKTLSNLLQGLSRLGFLEKGARKPMQDFIETPSVLAGTELKDTERSVIAYAIRPDVSNNLAMRPNTAPAATGFLGPADCPHRAASLQALQGTMEAEAQLLDTVEGRSQLFVVAGAEQGGGAPGHAARAPGGR